MGSQLLAAWIKASGLSLRAAALRLKSSKSTVGAWAIGKRRPSWPARRVISRVTKGAVPVAAWGDK